MNSRNNISGNANQFPAIQQSNERSVVLYDANLNDGLDNDEIDLLALWRVVLRYRKLIVLIFALVVATSAIMTVMKRPIYKASALLEINTGGRNLVKFQSLENEKITITEHLSTQATILGSQAVAAEVVKRLNLTSDPELSGQLRQRDFNNGVDALLKFVKQSGKKTYSDDALMKSTIKRYLSRLSIDPIRKSTLINVRFKSFDPELSSKIVNEHLKAYIWLSAQRRYDSTSGAKQFLQSEISKAQTKLENSQKSLTEFARENGVIDTEDRDNIMLDRLTKLSQDLSTVQSARIDAETRFTQSKSVGSDQLSIVIEDGLIKDLRQKQAGLRAEYNELSKIYKSGYPVMRQLQAKIDELEASIQTQANNRVVALQTNFEQLRLREEHLKAELEVFKGEMLDLQDRAVIYNILKREFEANRQLYVSLLERTKEVGVATGMELNIASVVDHATPSNSASSPNLKSSLLAASMLGLVGALGVAFMLAMLDNTINDPEQLRKLTRVNYLGLAPAINKLAEDDDNVRTNLFNTVTHHQPGSNFSEAIQSMRTSLSFMRGDGLPKSVMITSATAGEGKSTLAMNLAISYAKSGKQVVVVDADLRRSRYSKVFNVPESPGLSEYLNGQTPEKLYSIESIRGLSLMVSGHGANNPVDLLGSHRMHELIQQYEQDYDLVIVDCPPVQGIADAILISTLVDALILVVAAGKVPQEAVKDTIQRLRMVNAPIIGTVLNNLLSKSSNYSAYYSDYISYRKVS